MASDEWQVTSGRWYPRGGQAYPVFKERHSADPFFSLLFLLISLPSGWAVHLCRLTRVERGAGACLGARLGAAGSVFSVLLSPSAAGVEPSHKYTTSYSSRSQEENGKKPKEPRLLSRLVLDLPPMSANSASSAWMMESETERTVCGQCHQRTGASRGRGRKA